MELQQEERKERRVYATISKAALCHNMEAMQAALPAGVKLAGVVKADGYGHGAASVCEVIKPYVAFYCVAAAEEALELRRKGVEKPILILGPMPGDDYATLIRAGVRPSVFTEEQAVALSAAAVSLGVRAPFHLAVDTGMNRIGLRADETGVALAEKIAACPMLDFEGMFTHFYRADEWDLETTERQLARFRNFKAALEKKGLKPRICHVANSAGILNLHGTDFDMVRAGIALYGIYPAEEMAHAVKLEPALSLHSTVTYVKDVPAGEAISYGGTYVAETARRVATVPVGYGDGYPRSLSNKGEVLIHGRRCRILGRVCMDQLMVDVSEVPEAAAGSEVTLLGEDGDERITLEELSERSGRFPYEFMCCLNRRVPRIYC